MADTKKTMSAMLRSVGGAEEENITTEKKESRYQIKNIKVADLMPNSLNMYSIEKDEEYIELVEGIRKDGLREPVEVLPEENGKYTLLSGHRRRLAMLEIGIETCPAKIKREPMSKSEVISYLARGNTGARGKRPFDIALELKEFYAALEEEGFAGNKVKTACDTFGLSSSTFYRFNSLSDLAKEILLAGQAGLISASDAYAVLSRMKTPDGLRRYRAAVGTLKDLSGDALKDAIIALTKPVSKTKGDKPVTAAAFRKKVMLVTELSEKFVIPENKKKRDELGKSIECAIETLSNALDRINGTK